MKFDIIAEETLELSKQLQEKENNLINKLNEVIKEINDFNLLTEKIEKNGGILESVYEEELKENKKYLSFDPFLSRRKISSLLEELNSLKINKVLNIDFLDIVMKIYLNDKLESNLTIKETKEKINKI